MSSSFSSIYNAWKSGETFAVVMRSKDEKGFTLCIPKAQQLTAASASREGLINWDLNLKALRNDSEIKTYQEVTWELIVGKKCDEVNAAAKKAVRKS
jgi:hypothetical protein